MIRLQNALKCAASLNDVSLNATRQSNIVVRQHKNFEVKEVLIYVSH